MKNTSNILLLAACVLLQTACSNQAAYLDEAFDTDSPFKLKTERDIAMACESVRRALLGQGYLIDLASSEEVKARKATRGEGKTNSFIEMSAVCVPDSSGSTIYASGVLSDYAMKMSSSSASVGVAAIGSISLPIGQSVDSLVKVSEQTIDDKDFYKRFFTAVDTILGEMPVNAPSEEVGDEVVESEATPQPVSQPAIWPELFPEKGETAAAPADSEPAQQPVTQPAILPELFQGKAATEAPPEALPVQTTGPEVATEYPTARIAPETYPAAAAPEVVPEASPAPVESTPLTESFPVQLDPVTDPETVAQDQPPAISSNAVAAKEPSGIDPLPVPDEEPMGISPAPAPHEEEAVGVSPQSVEAAPLGIPQATVPANRTPAADASQLAPIQVTPVKLKSVPTAAAQTTPKAAVGEPPAPAPGVEDLF
jgi:Uncharacterized protein conserved in bacteria (DUF2242)